ncbi:fimbrillin family protein [uncultured Bacteroides sp.]|uniref:fimbrillin family protein n=1 Tax=uncultured Bacteroides sp. TaxID=162156 RepID=UPI0027D936AD|nr:fimbrillin family protein [uncultured Bacteroides sp.]
MKSKIFFGIATMLLLASCEETIVMEIGNETDKTSTFFSATTESAPSTRTALSSYTNDNCYSLNWSAGDAISISDGTSTAVYTTNDDFSPTAEFMCSEGKISNTANQYVAYYPSTITTTNMVLPATQNFVERNIENFPMRAVSNSKNLAFKNLCGIIRFCLKTEEYGQVSVSSISLSGDKGMSGAFTVSDDNAAIVTGTDGVMLKCADPEILYSTSSTDFNIIVPQGEYNPLKVKICDSNGKEVNLISEGAIHVTRSQITRITLTLSKSTFGTSLETIPITDSDVDFTER